MRHVDRLTGLAAIVAAGTAALPAGAAQGREPWAKVGEWEVTPFRAGSCSVARTYPGGTSVLVSSRQRGDAALSVFNRGWPKATAGPYRIRLVQGGAPRSLADGSNTFLHGLGVATESGDSLLAQLAGGGVLEVSLPDGRLLERVDLGRIAPALAKLGPCLSEEAAAAAFPPVAAPPPPPGPPLRIAGRGPRAQAPLATLFSSDDYPAAAARAGEEGAVGFRLHVGKDGRVAACTVTASSGSAALDSTTCQLIALRARFQPARDAQGKPADDSVSGRIVWRLPKPEPPPPSSPQS